METRLKKEKDFEKVFKTGKRIFSSRLTLIYLPSDQTKVGYAVGKKHGGSVKRNKIKRYLRESFRSFMPLLRQNFFFVFIPKAEEDYNFFDTYNEMKHLLIKGGFIEKC